MHRRHRQLQQGRLRPVWHQQLQMAQEFPRESRLFANEIVQGAPRVLGIIEGPLKELVDEKAVLIRGWIDAGRLAPVDPHHLIFSIWSLTQHYADFDVQIRAVLPGEDPFAAAPDFVETLYRRLLTP